MGKNNRKKKGSLNQLSFSFEAQQNSSYESYQLGNISFHEGILPEKLIVSSAESAGCAKYTEYLKSDWKDVVFLHPLIMRAYNIQNLVLIKGEQRTILCTSYPLQKLKKFLIVFPKKDNCPFKYEELVSVSSYESEIKCAEEIVISFPDEKDVDEKMKNFIMGLLYNKYIYTGLLIQWKLFGRDHHCTIKDITCSPDISNLSLNYNSDCHNFDFYIVNYKTVLKTDLEDQKCENKSALSHIGGLEKPLESLRKYMQMFLSRDKCMSSKCCGILMLEGPSGTGKSLLLEAILKDYDIYKEYISWFKIYSKSQFEQKTELKSVFQRAVDRSPSIIVIDEFNHLCPRKNKAENQEQHICKIMSQLIETLDETKVMVIAAANDSDYDNFTLQTSERLMEVIKFPIPTAIERIDILKKLLDSSNHELTFEQIEKCAKSAHGFTGKDLLTAVEDACISASKREYFDILDSDEHINGVESISDKTVKIKFCDLEHSVKGRKTTASDLKVKVQWTDIGGMTEVKEKLKQLVEWPLKYPEAFKCFNITPSRGVLMYGPPGCSKTMIAKALATECELNFIFKKPSDLFDKYVGESEKAVRDLFAMAKTKSPCIIFLDEIDALVVERGSSASSSGVGDRLVTTLLTEMDGIEELRGVIIIAATNRPDMLDDALVRNGRINHFIYIPLPDASAREEILKINMRGQVLSEDFDFKVLTEKTEGYSGAEVVNLCKEAIFQLLAEYPKLESQVLKFHHFERALKYVVPRTNKETIKFYEEFNKKHCHK